MTDPDGLDGLARRFETDRPHLRAVAQRILEEAQAIVGEALGGA